MTTSTSKCKLCGHDKTEHAEGMGPCIKIIRTTYTAGARNEDAQLRNVTVCNCPRMTWRVWKWKVVKLDYKLDERLREYIGSLGGLDTPVPSYPEIVRRAVDEWLKGKGY